MNKDLLETPIVKGQIKRYKGLNYSNARILKRLSDIHLIIISEEELVEFINNDEELSNV